MVGRQKTWNFKVYQDGAVYDLTGDTVLAKAVKPDGTSQVDGSVTVSDATEGEFNVALASSDNDSNGRWLMDIYIGSSSLEEPTNTFWAFESWASEVE